MYILTHTHTHTHTHTVEGGPGKYLREPKHRDPPHSLSCVRLIPALNLSVLDMDAMLLLNNQSKWRHMVLTGTMVDWGKALSLLDAGKIPEVLVSIQWSTESNEISFDCEKEKLWNNWTIVQKELIDSPPTHWLFISRGSVTHSDISELVVKWQYCQHLPHAWEVKVSPVYLAGVASATYPSLSPTQLNCPE